VAGVPTAGQVFTSAQYTRAARSARDLAWLGAAADTVELCLQRLASMLAGMLGCQAALLCMLPVMLMVRPLLSLMRSVPHSWSLQAICVLVLCVAIVAGPLFGTRAGLVLLAIYVLGWTCTLKSLYTAESAEFARARLARAGRMLRDRFTPVRPQVTRDRRN
jgi:hypothetical protein